jgi:hypothetical protein
MKCTLEVDSSAIIYIPSFIKIGSGIQKLRDMQTHRQYGDPISLLLFIYFFQNRESRLKI